VKTLIVGLGNPILGDDGVGWKVLEQIKQRYQEKGIPEPFETDFLAVGGLRLMERLVGY
jgi:Ni,Fe-hydrogenase maturation factor